MASRPRRLAPSQQPPTLSSATLAGDKTSGDDANDASGGGGGDASISPTTEPSQKQPSPQSTDAATLKESAASSPTMDEGEKEESKEAEDAEEVPPPSSPTILDMPTLVLAQIFAPLTYETLSVAVRGTCRALQWHVERTLNEGFERLARHVNEASTRLKKRLPRKESERR